LLLISHDRDFLDRVVDHVMHIEQQGVKLYTGNYSEFETRRAEQLAQQQALYEKQQQEVAHIESFVRRFRAKASKAKQAQSRLKTLQRMELISRAHVDSPFHFSFSAPDKLPHPLLSLDQVAVGYGDTPVVSDISLSILPGDRIGLLGHNGAGKSTLIKLLAGDLSAMQGDLTASSELKIGYFAQHQLEQLDPQASPMLHLQRLDAQLTEQAIRDYLGGFNFQGDRVLEPVAPFSGGEKARLVLALLIYQKPNLLLLDEPTNHLDLDMRHALSLALQDYAGAMLLVSHDRHLLRSVSEQFLLVDRGHLRPFDDDLDAYRSWLLKESATSEAPSTAGTDQALSRKQQRQQEAEQRRALQPLKKDINHQETLMENINAELGDIEQSLAGADIYQAENREQLQALQRRQGELRKQLEQAEERWFQLSEQLQALES
jgi:ATP-binding cassette subfamily F protein 3